MANKYRLNPLTNRLEPHRTGVRASDITVNTTTFDGILSDSDSNVQEALNTIDDLSHGNIKGRDEDNQHPGSAITVNAVNYDTLQDIADDLDTLDTNALGLIGESGGSPTWNSGPWPYPATYADSAITITSTFTGFCYGATTQKAVNELLDVLPRQRYTGLLYDSFGIPIAHVASGMITGLYTMSVSDDWYRNFIVMDGLGAVEL